MSARLLALLVLASLGACAESTVPTRGGAAAPSVHDSAPDAPEPDLDALLKRAEAALEAKDFALARKLAQETIDADENGFPYAYVILGDVAFAERAFPQALACYQKSLSLDPADDWATERAAETLGELGRKKEARALLRAYVVAHPAAGADVYDALGWAESDAKDATHAEAAFQQALKISGGKDADAYYGLALIAAERRRPKETEQALRALFALEPERRIEAAHDEAFDDVRRFPNVGALFDKKHMAEATAATKASH